MKNTINPMIQASANPPTTAITAVPTTDLFVLLACSFMFVGITVDVSPLPPIDFVIVGVSVTMITDGTVDGNIVGNIVGNCDGGIVLCIGGDVGISVGDVVDGDIAGDRVGIGDGKIAKSMGGVVGTSVDDAVVF